MRIKDQDFLTGVMFLLIGASALVTIYFVDRLSMGTTQRPGTGVLPAILSWCLIGTGGLLIGKAMIAVGEPVKDWAWRPLLAVTSATVLFGALIDDLGLVVTMIISLMVCALGTLETRWREFWMFLGVMIVGSWAMFIWLLGMPIPTWPSRLPSLLHVVFR